MAGFALAAIVAATCMRQTLLRENRRLDAGEAVLVDGIVTPIGAVGDEAEGQSSATRLAVERGFRYLV